jgi:hypothetical protein
MRRRAGRSRLGLIAAAALAVVIAVSALMSFDRYRAPPAAPPSALEHVAEKNRRAAIVAAARQRAEAAAATNATEALVQANLEAGR